MIEGILFSWIIGKLIGGTVARLLIRQSQELPLGPRTFPFLLNALGSVYVSWFVVN